MEEVTNGCLVHKDIRHIRVYRDLATIYQGNDTKAKIVRILETWINNKRNTWYLEATGKVEDGQPVPESPEFWISMSYRQFQHFLFETVSEETIKTTLNSLIKSNHVKRRIDPVNPYSAPQYTLNIKLIQKAIDKVYDPSSSSLVPHIPDLNGEEGHTPTQGVKLPPPPKITRGEDYPHPGGKVTPSPGGKITPPSNNSTKNTTNNKGTEEREKRDVHLVNNLHASNDALSLSFLHPQHNFLSFDDLTDPHLMVLELVPDDDQYWSELDYKHRTRVAAEIHYELEQQLVHPVNKRIIYRPTVFDTTVEASPPVEEPAAPSTVIDTESHSYSHAYQIPTPPPAQEATPEEKPELTIVREPAPEKPKRGKSDKQIAHEKRMAEIFTVFDELFAEHLDDPAYKVPRTNAKNKEKVRDLITQNATDQGIKNTWYSIKHDPDKFWQQEGRLTISCVSSQYASRCKKTLASAKPTSIMAKSNAFHERVEAARKIARGEAPFEEISMQILPLIPREEAIQYNATLRGIRRAAQLARQKAGA